MKQLQDIIWHEGEFRFRQKGTKMDKLTYRYHCCQDSVREKEMTDKVERKRDGRRMQRFPCKSKLTMRVSLQDRALSLCMYHVYHRPYQDLQLSPAVIEFIDTRVMNWTPSELYRGLLASSLPGTQSVTRHQVYYRWLAANETTCRRDAIPYVSATYLLSESGYEKWHQCIRQVTCRD
jgi:hypothetical protein